MMTVHFAAGSCTEWHTHDQGQYLESIRGTGWVGVQGSRAEIFREGERVWCPPGVPHRHGATDAGPWVQFSMTPGSTRWHSSDSALPGAPRAYPPDDAPARAALE